MTDDVVVTHGSGRTIGGREAVVDDLRRAFARWTVRQRTETEQTVVSGDWAFERAKVWTSLQGEGTATGGAVLSRTLTILRRDPGVGWRVARVMGVVDASPSSGQAAV